MSGEELIKEEFVKEFQHRLRNRDPDENWVEYTETVNEIVKMLMEREIEGGSVLTIEELKKVIKELRRAKAPGFDGIPGELLLEAGHGLLKLLLDVFNNILRQKEIPSQWNQVLITTIYKKKGSHKELINYRGIFLTIIASKVFERLLKNRMVIGGYQIL